jgi:hypothetical protein
LSTRYDLFGLIDFKGTKLSDSAYEPYVLKKDKTNDDSMPYWVKFDHSDSFTLVNEDEVINDLTPHVLFYRQKEQLEVKA